MIAHCFLLAAVLPGIVARFTNPPEIIRGTFHIGDHQTIKYDTKFTKYTIALWQEAVGGGAAKLGPIVFQTTNGPGSSFDWLVQPYDFVVEDSPTFFFWLFEGDSSVQGNASLPNMVSSYFTMAKAVTTSSTAPQSTSSSPVSSSIIASTPSSSPSTSTSTTQQQKSDSAGLSAGASAGIGIGAGLGVFLIAAVLFLVFWRRRYNKNNEKIAPAHSASFEQQYHTANAPAQSASFEQQYHSAQDTHQIKYGNAPAIYHNNQPPARQPPASAWSQPHSVEVPDNKPPAEMG